MKSWLNRIGRVFARVYLGVLILLFAFERFLIYPVPPKSLGNWSPTHLNVEDIHFNSADGTQLHGWYFEHPQPCAHILFCHGNGEHVSFLGDWLTDLSNDLRVSVFAFDYRGYGKSEGKPFERGVLQDAEAAQCWLANRVGMPPRQIVLYGRSLGGAVAVHLASSLGARGLVVERTFHSMVELGAKLYWWAPVKLLMRNRYPSIDRIVNYDGPFLQMHGTADEIVPIESAKRLFAACPSVQKTFLEVHGLGHNDYAPQSFFDAFGALLSALP